MGLFDRLKKRNSSEELSDRADNEITAVVTGMMIPAEQVKDPMFAKQMMGQTIAFEPSEGTICSPANGVVEMLFPTAHAFAVRMKDGTGLLVHIGIDTVDLNGDGFEACLKQGDTVKAGQSVVKVDLKKMYSKNMDITTMLVISEPTSQNMKVDYINFGNVTRGQVIAEI